MYKGLVIPWRLADVIEGSCFVGVSSCYRAKLQHAMSLRRMIDAYCLRQVTVATYAACEFLPLYPAGPHANEGEKVLVMPAMT